MQQPNPKPNLAAAPLPLELAVLRSQVVELQAALAGREQAEAELRQQFEQQLAQQRLIMEIAQRIRRSLRLEDILRTTVNEVRRFLQTDRVIILQFDPNCVGLVLVESVEAPWDQILGNQIYDPCFVKTSAESFRQGTVTAKTDIETANLEPCFRELLKSFQVRANLVVPILQDEELWGLLVAHHCSEPRVWLPLEIDLLKQLATHASIAIQQAALFGQVQSELLERRCTEAVLKEREIMLRALGDNLPNGMLYQVVREADGSDRFYYLSAGCEQISEVKPDAVLRNANLLYQQILPADQERLRLAVEASIADLSPLDLQIRKRTPSGQLKWSHLRSAPRRLEGGRIVWDGIEFDITEQKQIERELRQSKQESSFRESENQFRLLSESAPVGIFRADIHRNCTYTNPRCRDIFGCNQEESLGQGWMRFLSAEDRNQILTQWANLEVTHTDFLYEYRLAHPDGKTRDCRLQISPIFSNLGELTGYVGMIEDITESRAIAQMKNEFISVVSHELRTPLTSLRASLALLASGIYASKPDRSQRMLQVASESAERLMRLVNDILCLERLQSGKVTLVKETCSAKALIFQVIEVFQSVANQHRVKLRVSAGDLEIWAAPDAIVQTLSNLLSNAIKFSDPDSLVEISVRTIQHSTELPKALFSVKDQGRGIPTDKLESIFGHFQQVDASDSREKGGTGLGLAICRSIIQQHDGQIWAESILGGGSTFYFTLPLVFTDPQI